MKQFLPIQAKANKSVSNSTTRHYRTQSAQNQTKLSESIPGIPTRLKYSLSNIPILPPAETTQSSESGRPLPQIVRQKMERAFGQDFSDVRIHEGLQAPAIDALAYTKGADIHFTPGTYEPGSTVGQSLIGHELAHVVQQRTGRVQITQRNRISINGDPTLESEADRFGMQAAHGNRVDVRESNSTTQASTSDSPIQMVSFKKLFQKISPVRRYRQRRRERMQHEADARALRGPNPYPEALAPYEHSPSQLPTYVGSQLPGLSSATPAKESPYDKIPADLPDESPYDKIPADLPEESPYDKIPTDLPDESSYGSPISAPESIPGNTSAQSKPPTNVGLQMPGVQAQSLNASSRPGTSFQKGEPLKGSTNELLKQYQEAVKTSLIPSLPSDEQRRHYYETKRIENAYSRSEGRDVSLISRHRRQTAIRQPSAQSAAPEESPYANLERAALTSQLPEESPYANLERAALTSQLPASSLETQEENVEEKPPPKPQKSPKKSRKKQVRPSHLRQSSRRSDAPTIDPTDMESGARRYYYY